MIETSAELAQLQIDFYKEQSNFQNRLDQEKAMLQKKYDDLSDNYKHCKKELSLCHDEL